MLLYHNDYVAFHASGVYDISSGYPKSKYWKWGGSGIYMIFDIYDFSTPMAVGSDICGASIDQQGWTWVWGGAGWDGDVYRHNP